LPLNLDLIKAGTVEVNLPKDSRRILPEIRFLRVVENLRRQRVRSQNDLRSTPLSRLQKQNYPDLRRESCRNPKIEIDASMKNYLNFEVTTTN
jgi:hypothetical protein